VPHDDVEHLSGEPSVTFGNRHVLAQVAARIGEITVAPRHQWQPGAAASNEPGALRGPDAVLERPDGDRLFGGVVGGKSSWAGVDQGVGDESLEKAARSDERNAETPLCERITTVDVRCLEERPKVCIMNEIETAWPRLGSGRGIVIEL